MKAFWLSLLLFLFLSGTMTLTANATATSVGQQLDQMEQQLFAHTYDGDSTQNRLDRIEKNIFGTAHDNESVDSRIQGLSQFFQPEQPQQPNNNGVAQQPDPQQYSSQQSVTSQSQSPPSVPMASTPSENSTDPWGASQNTVSESNNGVQYPAISAMEQRVFHQTYEQDSLDNRLARLEKQVLGHVQNGTLQDRTDQLRLTVLGDPGTSSSVASQQDPTNSSNPSNIVSGNGLQPQSLVQNPGNAANNADVLQALPKVEQKILRRTYPQDNMNERLSRLEMKIFNATSPEMSPEDRLYRVVSVASAQNSEPQEQAYQGGGSSFGSGGSSFRRAAGSNVGIWGSMLLMILMSLI